MIIRTSTGVDFKIDDEDYDKCKGIKFRIVKGYVAYNEKHKTKKLHRLLIDAKEGQEVDHINRDKLDNRKSNLRIATRSENLFNRGGYGKVKHKGIWLVASGRFVASFTNHGRTKYIGTFETIQQAIEARREYV